MSQRVLNRQSTNCVTRRYASTAMWLYLRIHSIVYNVANSPFYSYGYGCPCFDTTLPPLLSKSCCSYANLYF